MGIGVELEGKKYGVDWIFIYRYLWILNKIFFNILKKEINKNILNLLFKVSKY